MHNGTTITQFIIEEQRHVAGATGDFTSLLNAIVTACKVISNLVNHGALVGVLRFAGVGTERKPARDSAQEYPGQYQLASRGSSGHGVSPWREVGVFLVHARDRDATALDRSALRRAILAAGRSRGACAPGARG